MRVFLVLAVLMLAGCADSDPADGDSDTIDDTPMDMTHEPLTFSESSTLLIGTQGADSCGVTGTVDTEQFTWSLPEGQKYRDFEIILEFGATGLDLDMTVSGPSGDAAATTFNTLEGTTSETIMFTGSVTPGDYVVTVVGCVNVATDFTLSGTVDVSDVVMVAATE